MINFLGYIGTAFMIAFSYTMTLQLAIIGLTLMSFQAAKAGLWNFVILNIISIIGFASNI